MACGAIGFGTTSTLMVGHTEGTVLLDKYSSLFLSQATGFNFPSILVTRIFLGVFIAGFAPQMTLYFCEFGALAPVTAFGPNSCFLAFFYTRRN